MKPTAAPAEIRPLVRYFCEFVHAHHRQVAPLVHRLFDAGFSLVGERPAGGEGLNDHLNQLRTDVDGAMARLNAYRRSVGGSVVLKLGPQTLVRLSFDDHWRFDLRLELFDNPRADVAAVQRQVLSLYELEDLEVIIELAAAFLSGITEHPFGYELHAGGVVFLQAEVSARRLRLQLVNLAMYLRVLLFFMRRTDLTVFARSPLELLRILEELQDFLRSLADEFEENHLAMEVEIERQVVYRCGHGVRPNLGGRFGDTAIQLDALARILAATVKRRGE